MSKVYTRFQTKTAQKALLFGAYIGEYPPPGGALHYETCTVDILLVS